MPDPTLPVPTSPTFYFIGVTTGHSSSQKMIPLWVTEMGRPEVEFKGIDLEINAAPEAYRRVVNHIKREPLALGALVTTHKIDLLSASLDLFDELGPFAKHTSEVSSISKEYGKLIGNATDPIAGGLSLDAILGPNYFGQNGGHVLILGAGGAATALTLVLLQNKHVGDRPQKMILVDKSDDRLNRLEKIVSGLEPVIQIDFVKSENPKRNDELMGSLPPGSVVINATGMGKDTPGSPITDAGIFPENGVAWELNYRGALEFLHQAHAQQKSRNLTVEDGWEYFVHGWSQVISHVLHVEMTPHLFSRLSELALKIRSR